MELDQFVSLLKEIDAKVYDENAEQDTHDQCDKLPQNVFADQRHVFAKAFCA
jgi:hypothetical protein